MKKQKKRKWPVVLAVLVLLIGAGAFYLFFGQRQPDRDIQIQAGEEGTNALIVYFTRSGNIPAEEKAGVDAVTSASLYANDGSTEFAAQKLQEATGADLLEIRTDRQYRRSYWGSAFTALIESQLNMRPALTGYPESLDQYDVIYVGYPIWWFNAPMPIGTFLEHYDLSGKTVVPFCTAQDNGIDVSMDYIRRVSGNATVLDGYRFRGNTTQEDIMNWLDGIGITGMESNEDDNTVAGNTNQTKAAVPADITVGTQLQRGFINDNTYHSPIGDIHYSSYIPEGYDGSEPYALFITLPGWEGLYFQGVGANMVEDYGTEAPKYNDKMIVLSTQLDDWGETSADMTIALTEYFLANYNIDPEKVYLEGLSGGGETGSIVMGKRPELYAAYLMASSQWDGDLNVLAESRTSVYMAIGEKDSYYGSHSLKKAYATLHDLYEKQGLSDDQIDKILILDVKDQQYFTERGFRDQHAGGMSFAHEEEIMSWLFGEHE